jgi:transcription initiation factor TFIID subunit 5
VTTASTTGVAAKDWEESTGLLSALLPKTASEQARTSQNAFNQSQGHLKLGPMPINDELFSEAERTMQQEAAIDPANAHAQYDVQNLRPAAAAGTLAPATSDLLPHPPNFRLMDMRREIERARDARKRIRLEPSMLGGMDPGSPQATAVRPRALPSVCAYTFHDVSEGYVYIAWCPRTPTDPMISVPCATFSADNSLMAAGSSESYVRLWSLKGEKLRGMRSDFQPSSIKDGQYST